MARLPEAFRRYLALLGVQASPPTLEALTALVRAHLIRVPFENLSKLYRVRRLGLRRFPTLDEFLDGIERHRLGGTCYANNYYLFELLRALGFECALCGAEMSAPDVHIVLVVAVGGRELLVDVGYAAPFYGPFLRDLPEVTRVPWGAEEFRLHPKDVRGRSRLDHLRNGERVHGYTVHPEPRDLRHFDRIIVDSYADSATFMNAVRFERFSDHGSVSLYNHSLQIIDGARRAVHALRSREDVVDALHAHLGVARELAAAALEGLPELRGIH